jgi:hypothetical protein
MYAVSTRIEALGKSGGPRGPQQGATKFAAFHDPAAFGVVPCQLLSGDVVVSSKPKELLIGAADAAAIPVYWAATVAPDLLAG